MTMTELSMLEMKILYEVEKMNNKKKKRLPQAATTTAAPGVVGMWAGIFRRIGLLGCYLRYGLRL